MLCGLGAFLPGRILTNSTLAEQLDTTDAWICEHTGIRARHRVGPGTSTGDLATAAAGLALASAGATGVDALVVGTTTPDRGCPATAPDVAARLGLVGIAAFDVSAVCASFLYALGTAAGLIAAGTARRVLVVGAETFSGIVDPADRMAQALFGDGAGAAVLRAGEPGEPGALGPVLLGSDGRHRDLITIPVGERYFRMRGADTFRHAVVRTSAVAKDAVRLAGWQLAEVDRFAAHQANARITAAVADLLGIPAGERRLANIDLVGNTAAASVPLLLAHCAADGRLRAGHRTLLAAFGGGLAWGATTLVWPELTAHIATA